MVEFSREDFNLSNCSKQTKFWSRTALDDSIEMPRTETRRRRRRRLRLLDDVCEEEWELAISHVASDLISVGFRGSVDWSELAVVVEKQSSSCFMYLGEVSYELKE